MDAEKLRVERDKLTRVFRYLEALNQHRNPAQRQIQEQPWTFWLRELPEHPSVQRGAARASFSKANDGNGHGAGGAGESFVLKVQRPRLTRAPEPPEQIAAWLKEGWDDPWKALAVQETLGEAEESVEPRTVKFTDDPRRIASLEHWQLRRSEWVKTEKPARTAMKIFESLYALNGRIDREGERVELVLGDGILSWRRADGRRHLSSDPSAAPAIAVRHLVARIYAFRSGPSRRALLRVVSIDERCGRAGDRPMP